MRKQGISTIVVTVLIILIIVAAVAVVWSSVIGLIGGRVDEGTLCIEAMGQVGVDNDKSYTCLDSDLDVLSLKIVRGAKDFVLEDIQVLVLSGGSSESFSVVNNAIDFDSLPGVNEARVFSFDVSGVVDGVKVASVISVDGEKEFCEASKVVEIVEC